jgi:hypothetical protein
MSTKFRYGYDVIDEGVGVIHERFVKAEYLAFLDKLFSINIVLEVGSGISAEFCAGVGFDSIIYAKKGKDVVLVDNLNENLRVIKNIYDDLEISNTIYLVIVCQSQMPFRSTSFDLAFGSYLVEFLDNPLKCQREMGQISNLILQFATNYLNVGHLIHKIFPNIIRAPWKNSGNIQTTLWFLRNFVKEVGHNIIESGAMDAIPWPSGVSVLKHKEYKYFEKIRILNPDTSPWTFRLLKLFYLFEKSLPMCIKNLQSHMVYILAQNATNEMLTETDLYSTLA